MKELKFIEGRIPKGFKPDFESSLFNEPEHRTLQAVLGWISFNLLDEDKKRIVAAVHFHVENGVAQSPYKAPFGSFEFSNKLRAADLFLFLQNVEAGLLKQSIRQIRIKNAPNAYRPAISSLLEVLLLNLDYRILRAEINASFAVNDVGFEEKIEAWELRKLKQGKKAKLAFRKIPIDSLEEVYAFILACRLERKQELSMSFFELKETVGACRERFFLFGVYDRDELVAASISIRVSRKIIYNFYSGHPRKFDSLSPIVSLMAGMYGWCQNQRIDLFDLGTSALENKPNFGLLDFKLNLGAEPSAKFTFVKDLS